MIILGLIVFISLYILDLPYYLGLIIIFLGVTFLFSSHRSFTHSIFGLLTLTATVSLILIISHSLIVKYNIFNSYYVLLLIVILLGFLFLNRNVFLIFLPLLVVSVLIFPIGGLDYIQLTISIFLGVLSHIILDSFTPSGIKLFAPLSSKKVHKRFGISCICFLIPLAILYYFNYGHCLFNFIIRNL